MKYFYIFIIIVFIYFFIEVVIFYYKISNLPTLVSIVHKETVLGDGKPLRYIAAGDSTAAGLGATSIENTYTFKIAKELSRTNTVYYKNIGVVGAKTKDVLEKQLQIILDYNPDIVTISIGGNDATRLKSKKSIIENEKKIIAEILDKTNATIYLTTIPNFKWASILPWFYRNIIEYKSKGINEEIKAFENERVKIVNIHDFGWDKYPNLDLTNAPDKFHPNDLGYQNWADAFLDRIIGK